MVSPGDRGAERVGRPGDPPQPESRVGPPDYGVGALFELVEELVEHDHAEQAEQPEVAAGDKVVCGVAVLVREVDRGRRERGTPYDTVASVGASLFTHGPEGQKRERDRYPVECAGHEIFPPVVPADDI